MPKSVESSFDLHRPGVVMLRPRAIMLIEIDKQIERLSGQYQEIIQSRSFQKLKTRQGQVDLAFVCFYVILLTARYLGWRCRARPNIAVTSRHLDISYLF